MRLTTTRLSHPLLLASLATTAIALTGLGCSGTSKPGPSAPLQLEAFNPPKGRVGEPFQLTLRARGGEPPYLFTLGSGNLPPGLTLSREGVLGGNPTVAGSFTFSVSAQDTRGGVSQGSGTLQVADRLILETPRDFWVLAGQPCAHVLVATGGTPPYAWSLKAGTLPEGITLQSQGLLTGSSPTSGDFPISIQVKDAEGFTASCAVTFSVVPPLAFALEPAPQSVLQGSTATFTSRVAGSAAGARYTWEQNGVVIPGAQAADLQLHGVRLLDDGSTFTCVLTRGSETVRSRTVTLQVSAGVPPSAQIAVAPNYCFAGDTASLAVVTSGTPPITYQWYRGDQPIPGATQAALSYPNVRPEDHCLQFVAKVSNAFGSDHVATSFSVYPQGAIHVETEPVDAAATIGGTARFFSEAIGSIPPAYQWLKNGSPIPGATQSILTLTPVSSSDVASYACRISCGEQTFTTRSASLAVVPFTVGYPQTVLRIPVGVSTFPAGFLITRASLQPGAVATFRVDGLPPGVHTRENDLSLEVPPILGEIAFGTNWDVDASAQPGTYSITARMQEGTTEYSTRVTLEIQAGYALEPIPNRRFSKVTPEVSLPVQLQRHPTFTHPVDVYVNWNHSLDPRIVQTWDNAPQTGSQRLLRLYPGAGAWPAGPILLNTWITASAPWPSHPQVASAWVGIDSLCLDLPESVTLHPGSATTIRVGAGRALDEGTVTLAGSSPKADLNLEFLGGGRLEGREAQLRIQAESTLAPGTYALPVTAQGNTSSASGTVTLRVPAPGAPVDRWIHRLELGQTLLKSDLRLVAGKEAWLRATVLADRPGVASPKVRLTGYLAGQTLGPLLLEGPTQLPTREEAPDVASVFCLKLPAAWVKPGLRLRINLDPESEQPDAFPDNDTLEHPVQVGLGPVLPVTWVPIHINGQAPVTGGWDTAVRAAWPIAAVHNKLHPPVLWSGGLSSPDDWSTLLSHMMAMRLVEDPGRIYAGLAPRAQVSGAIAGIAFCPGYDLVSLDDPIPLLHEFGHLFGLRHAPCGGVASHTVEPFYPYPSGQRGSWGVRLDDGSLISPHTTYDVMSYCWPQWPSEWSYERAQVFLERNPFGALMPRAPESEAEQLLISGVVEGGRVRLNPVHRLRMPASPPEPGPHTLQVESPEGRQRIAFQAMPMSLDGPTQGFAFTVPASKGTVLSPASSSAKTSPEEQEQPLAPRIETEKGRLRLRWDARKAISALVVHVGREGRTVIALNHCGGDLILPTEGLDPNGHLEVSMSDGTRPTRFILGTPDRK